MLRWLYHVATVESIGGDPYAPASLAADGFVHCSYRRAVRESARLYFESDAHLCVLCIDPRRLEAKVEIVATPRGPMPHVHGPIPRDAILDVMTLDQTDAGPDAVTGTHFAFVAFPGMTLLDLVGVHDPISRVRSMGFDPDARFEIVSAGGGLPWGQDGARFDVGRVRPDLGEFDVLVVPGGKGTRELEHDAAVTAWLAAFPRNRLAASVCTGALLLGAAGRLEGKRATTHASALGELGRFGATAAPDRVVEDGQLVTGGGVTAGIDVGLHVVERLYGEEVAKAISRQMEWVR